MKLLKTRKNIPEIPYRIEQLKRLRAAILRNEEKLFEALYQDLGKSKVESYSTEIGLVLSEISLYIKNLKSWCKPKRVVTNWKLFPLAKSYIYHDPLGEVLIVTPWNYPFMLSLSPLVGAVAAGNKVTLKPSEIAAHTAQIIQDIINDAFDKNEVKVVLGGAERTQELLLHKWDYIFYTGSERVGKIIMQAAAQNLSPLTLELGGKSPCLVDNSCDLDKTANRIVYGKFTNAGQTCIAPDYILVDESIKSKLLVCLADKIKSFYGENPESSNDFGRIINANHFERLTNYLKDVKIVHGGKTNKTKNYISPTLVEEVEEKTIMEEEIFGPILPIITYSTIDEAIDFVNKRPKPLALYIYSENKKIQQSILKKTTSGTVCINDSLLQIANENLPFGGVGNSGFGKYRGKAGFDTFSHIKSVFVNTTLFELPLRFPPFHKKTLKFIKLFMK